MPIMNMMPGGGGESIDMSGYPAILTKDERISTDGSGYHRIIFVSTGVGNVSATQVNTYFSTKRYFMPLKDLKFQTTSSTYVTLNAGQSYYLKTTSGTSAGTSYYYLKVYDNNGTSIGTFKSIKQSASDAGTNGTFIALYLTEP